MKTLSIVASAFRLLEEDEKAPKAEIRYVKWRRKKGKKYKRVALETRHSGTLKEMEKELDHIAKMMGQTVHRVKGVSRVDLNHYQVGEKISFFIRLR